MNTSRHCSPTIVRRSAKLATLFVVSVVASPNLGCEQSKSKLGCLLQAARDPGPLVINRLALLIEDASRSMDVHRAQLRETSKKRLIEPTAPGDWIDGFRLGDDGAAFDDSDLGAFPIRAGRPPQVRAAFASGAIDAAALASGCDDMGPLRRELNEAWARFRPLQEKWSREIDALESPRNPRKSAYFATLAYVGERFQKAPAARSRLLYVIGDLEDDVGGKPRAHDEVARDLLEAKGPVFRGVKVRLMRPSKRGEAEVNAKWASYFKILGAPDVKVMQLGDIEGVGLEPSLVPPAPAL